MGDDALAAVHAGLVVLAGGDARAAGGGNRNGGAVMAPNRELHRELTDRTKSEKCLCGAPLSVAVDPAVYNYVLRCQTCGNSPDTQPKNERSPLQRWERGESLNAIEAMQVGNLLQRLLRRAQDAGDEAGAVRRDLQIERLERSMTSLTTYQAKKDLIPEVEATRFVDLAKVFSVNNLRAAAIALVRETGLQPLLGELTVYENQLYIPIKGLRRLLLDSTLYEGEEEPEFLTAEKRDAMGYEADDIVVTLRSYRKGRKGVITGTGKASRDKRKAFRNSQVEQNWPSRTAENRAFRQMFIKGWQDILLGHKVLLDAPDDIATGSGSGANTSVRDVPPEINPITGEYMDSTSAAIDGQFTVVPDTDPTAPSAPETLQGEAPAAAAPPELTPDEMDERLVAFLAPVKKTLADADTWFGQTFGMRWQDMDVPMRETALHDLQTAVRMNQSAKRAGSAAGAGQAV